MWVNCATTLPEKEGVYTVNTKDGENVQMYFKGDKKLAHWYHPKDDGTEPVSGWVHNEHIVWWWKQP